MTTIPTEGTLTQAKSGRNRAAQTTETLQKLYDGTLRLERRNGGSRICARTFIGGKSLIHSAGELTLHAATKIATDTDVDARALHADFRRRGVAGRGGV